MRSADRIVAVLVLLGIATLCLARAVDLGRQGWTPSAEGERRWFRWAYRDPAERRALEALAAGVAAGEEVLLVVPPGPAHDSWYRVIGNYYLLESRIVGVSRETPEELPSGARVLELPAPGRADGAP